MATKKIDIKKEQLSSGDTLIFTYDVKVKFFGLEKQVYAYLTENKNSEYDIVQEPYYNQQGQLIIVVKVK